MAGSMAAALAGVELVGAVLAGAALVGVAQAAVGLAAADLAAILVGWEADWVGRRHWEHREVALVAHPEAGITVVVVEVMVGAVLVGAVLVAAVLVVVALVVAVLVVAVMAVEVMAMVGWMGAQEVAESPPLRCSSRSRSLGSETRTAKARQHPLTCSRRRSCRRPPDRDRLRHIGPRNQS